MRTVGITGGICSGKTTISEWLVSESHPVIDTDTLAHELYEKNSEVQNLILEEFGTLDRRELRAQAFESPEKRKILESILHPKIEKELNVRLSQLKKENREVAFVIVPLLFEVGWEDRFDEIWTVSAKPETQLSRLSERGIERNLAQKILQSQFGPEDREEKSDLVLLNDGAKSDLYDQLRKAIEDLT